MSYMIYLYDFSCILKPQKSNQQIYCVREICIVLCFVAEEKQGTKKNRTFSDYSAIISITQVQLMKIIL